MLIEEIDRIDPQAPQRVLRDAADVLGPTIQLPGLIFAIDDAVPELGGETDSPAVIAAYERKIAALENQKLAVTEKIETGAGPRHALEDLFERAMSFLSSP